MKLLASLITIFAFTTCINSLQAQPEERVNVTLCGITVKDNIKGIKYQSGSEVRSLDVLRALRSEYFDYSGSPIITFFRESGTGDEVTRIPVGQCKIPAKRGDFMLVFSKIAGAKEGYRITALPDSMSNFSPGTYRFINLAPFEIALKLDETVHEIKARNYTDVRGDFVDGNYYKAIMVSVPKDSKPMRVYKGRVLFSNDKRILYIMTPKEGGRPGRIQITTIVERPEVKEQAP